MVTKNVKNKYKKPNKTDKKVVGSKKTDKPILTANKSNIKKKPKLGKKLPEKKPASKLKIKVSSVNKNIKNKTTIHTGKIVKKTDKTKKTLGKKVRLSPLQKSSNKTNVVKKSKSIPIKTRNKIKDMTSQALQDKEQYLENNEILSMDNNDTSINSNLFSSLPVNEESGANLIGPSKFKPYHIDVTEGYMNEQQLKHFEHILQNWKQELMLEVDNTITEMKEADILADPNDRATQEETFNLELRTRDRERKLIKKIEAALTKINEQRYGYCDSCGIEIGIRRLEARPTATLCIECKTLAEIREKRT